MTQVSIDAPSKITSKVASSNEYNSLIVDFYTNQRKGWIYNLIKRGVDKNDAEDIFSSVIEYLLSPQTYQNYLKSNKKYNQEKTGLAKITGFASFIFAIFRTKVSNYFRSCKRKLDAMTKFAQTLNENDCNPENIAAKAEEQSSAANGGMITLIQNTYDTKINPSYKLAA